MRTRNMNSTLRERWKSTRSTPFKKNWGRAVLSLRSCTSCARSSSTLFASTWSATSSGTLSYSSPGLTRPPTRYKCWTKLESTLIVAGCLMLSESCSCVAFLLRSSILWLTCTRGKIEALMELEEALKTLESQLEALKTLEFQLEATGRSFFSKWTKWPFSSDSSSS